jgi:hypothetical protein
MSGEAKSFGRNSVYSIWLLLDHFASSEIQDMSGLANADRSSLTRSARERSGTRELKCGGDRRPFTREIVPPPIRRWDVLTWASCISSTRAFRPTLKLVIYTPV